MKRQYLFFVLFLSLLIAINFISAASFSADCNPVIKLVNQDPNPAVPNDYVKVLLEVSGIDSSVCSGLTVKLVPEYPFSLDSGVNPVQSISGNTASSGNYKSSWDVPYRVRVSPDALKGDYKLKLFYSPGSVFDVSNQIEQEVTISVASSQTDFSAVIQQATSSQVSIGIVNTGTNQANSLIVSIPQQSGFSASGISQQIIGNLAAGDYTIVTFNIAPRVSRNFNRTGSQNPGGFNSSAVQQLNASSQSLKVQLDYTDNIGIRRTVTEDIPFSPSLLADQTNSTRNFSRTTSSSASGTSSLTFYAIVIVSVAAIVIAIYKTYGKKNSKKIHKNSTHDPDWVSSERTHKK